MYLYGRKMQQPDWAYAQTYAVHWVRFQTIAVIVTAYKMEKPIIKRALTRQSIISLFCGYNEIN